MKALVLRMLAAEKPKWTVSDAIADPEQAMEMMEKEAQVGAFEIRPLVSVQPRTLIFVKFLSEAREVVGRDGKEKAYVDILMLADTKQAYDTQARKPMALKKDAKASINLKRHVNLWKAAQHFAPLKNRSFCIANVGKVKTKRGSACDYRWKELAEA